MLLKFKYSLILVVLTLSVKSQDADSTKKQWLNLHFQQTVITQYHPEFSAKYSGLNSLQTKEDPATSLTSTLYVGARLWKGASAFFNPELAGGSGFSQARGIAGFVNGETFRIGSSAPKIYLARLYLKQIFSLSKEYDKVSDDFNQLKGTRSKSYIAVMAGKFSVADFIDFNKFSHDPRTHFINWSLMSNGAWDYPANTRGYTQGVVVEYTNPGLSVRLASTMVPSYANGPVLENDILNSHSETIEIERRYHLGKRDGTIRFLGFMTHANMGNYNKAVQNHVLYGDSVDITSVRSKNSLKYGFGVNIEQDLTKNFGLFARAGWNDGNNETWAFTEIDQSLSLGFVWNGAIWKCPDDHFGVASVLNGISSQHAAYLKAGGYGFIVGDGNLNYNNEFITEVYYYFKVPKYKLWLTPDYQYVVNPAYNKDRGPVHCFALRAHVEF